MTFYDYIQNHFFVVSSDNWSQITNSKIYGYCIVDGIFVRDCILPPNTNIKMDTPGLFIAFLKEEKRLRIIQDSISFLQIYFFRNEKYWAFSNSFWMLCDEVKKHFPLTLDELYCEQFFSSGVTPLTVSRTLAKEVKIIPSRTQIIIENDSSIRLIQDNDILVNKIPVNTKEGIGCIDKWIGRWASIIRSIYDAGFRIKIDLTGGYDSRISLALAIASGIDLNSEQITIYSRRPSDVYGDEDWKIASKIADRFHFSLSKDFNLKNRKSISGRDCFEINRLTLSNCHREPYFPNAFYEKPVFYLNGKCGENVRGWKQRDDFIKSFKNPIGRSSVHYQPVVAQYELILDWDSLPTFSLNDELNEKERNRYYMMEVRSRNHFGVVAYQDYLSNYIQLTPFNDSDILRVGLVEGMDTTSMFTIILSRICPSLLEFPVQGGRKYSNEGLALGHELRTLYPPQIDIVDNALLINETSLENGLDIDPGDGVTAESILDQLFDEGELIFKEYFGEYGDSLYDDARINRMNSSIPYQRQYESVIVSIVRMIIIEEECRNKEGSNAKRVISRYVNNNRAYEDVKMLKHMSSILPDNELIKEELKLALFEEKEGRRLLTFDENMSIEEMIDLLGMWTNFAEYSDGLIHDIFRQVLISDKYKSLSMLEKRNASRKIRKVAASLPDTKILTKNSTSMKLFLYFGIHAFREISFIKSIFR